MKVELPDGESPEQVVALVLMALREEDVAIAR